jgi:hypothetical protein
MKNKLLLASCFFLCSSLVAEESSYNIIQTNHSDVYIKNAQCEDNYRLTFNVVNKSDKYVWRVNLTVYDPSGDPVDQGKLEFKYPNYIRAQSGYAGSIGIKNCKALEKTHKLSFTVEKEK